MRDDADATRRWQALDARHHLHPFTTHRELAARGTRVIVRGEGVRIWDSSGHEMIDGMAGLWCVQVGYGRERLALAAARQMRELSYYNSFFQCTTAPTVELAATLARLLPPGVDRLHFVGSGSEATETAIKTVWYYWNLEGRPTKKAIIARRHGYHGSLVASGSATGMAYMHAPFDLPLPGFHHIDPPYWFAEGGDLSPAEFGLARARALEAKILELGPENVGAFLAEPIQGAGGVIIPPATYWPEIQRVCRAYDVLLVVDEVITGFGRTGRWWGLETFGIEPDIVTMAKGLSSGYVPIGAVAFGGRVGSAVFEGGSEYATGLTYAGHPVAAAVALENLAVMEEEGLSARGTGPTGAYFAERLATLRDHPLVGEVRARGLIACIELCADKATRRPFDRPGEVGLRCRNLAVEEGLVMRAIRDGMVLAPPLVVSEGEIDEIVARAGRAIERTAREIGR